MAFLDTVLERLSGVKATAPQPSTGAAPPPPVVQRAPLPPAPQPVKVPRRSSKVDRRTYLARLDTPLVRLGPNDVWTIEDACSSTHIYGGNGSGKTTGSGQTIAKSFLEAGFGGLVCCAKPEEARRFIEYATETGRSKHLIVVREDGPWRYNLLQHELNRAGDPAGRVDSLVTILMALIEQSGRRAGGDDSSFWQQAAEQLLKNALLVLVASSREITLLDLHKFIDAIPRDGKAIDTEAWQSSEMAQRLDEARQAYEAAGRRADYDAIHFYLTSTFPNLADRTRSSVTFTLSTMLQDLLVGTLRELFATGTNFFPEDTHEGAIIILDLPAVTKRGYATAQILFKAVWQAAALRRMEHVDRDTRPIFLWADESHFFVTEFDNRFQSLARAARVATVYLTQNISAYRAKLGAQNSGDLTNWLMGLFQTHIFHAQSDPATITHAQQLFGKREITRVNDSASDASGTNTSMAYNSGGSSGSSSGSYSSSWTYGNTDTRGSYSSSWTYGNTDTRGTNRTTTHGYSTSTSIEHVLEAHHFTALATGTDQLPFTQRHLRGISQAYVFRLGRTWSTGDTHLLAHFDRRI
jgi:hypothetical protein